MLVNATSEITLEIYYVVFRTTVVNEIEQIRLCKSRMATTAVQTSEQCKEQLPLKRYD